MSAAVGRRLEQRFTVIRGFPGVGKTAVLRELAALGTATLDLETLASHRGSAFGHLGMPTQPTARDFASRIELSLSAAGGNLFVEAEGGALGRLAIPHWLRQVIASSDYILLQDTLETRLARIVATYELERSADLVAAIATLEHRVGKAIVDQAHSAVLKGDLSRAAGALLPYYEAAYSHQIARCSGRLIATIDVGGQPPTHIAHEALQFAMAASGLATKVDSCEEHEGTPGNPPYLQRRGAQPHLPSWTDAASGR
jgi:tRNA 2-selenouridine synthase